MLILSRTRRIDYPRMVENLRTVGMSMQQIADAVGVTREGMRNWCVPDATGEPAGWVCIAFLELWCERTGLKWTDIPTRIVSPSVSQVLRSTA